ncbi:hypothetical protein HS7_12810 [Sulfolobales archaeon HS-7]|nr:hypothetical protein HS7_12810 [Sulfolobales archaeon HS-7]
MKTGRIEYDCIFKGILALTLIVLSVIPIYAIAQNNGNSTSYKLTEFCEQSYDYKHGRIIYDSALNAIVTYEHYSQGFIITYLSNHSSYFVGVNGSVCYVFFDRHNSLLYVQTNNALCVYNGDKVIKALNSLGGLNSNSSFEFCYSAVDTSNGEIYALVATYIYPNEIVAINPNNYSVMVKKISSSGLSTFLNSIVYDSYNNKLFVLVDRNGNRGQIYSVNPSNLNLTLIANTSIGFAMGYYKDNLYVFVENTSPGNCTVDVVNTVTGNVTPTNLKLPSTNLAISLPNGEIYAGTSNGTYVINANTTSIAAEIPVTPNILSGMAYDPSNDLVFIDGTNLFLIAEVNPVSNSITGYLNAYPVEPDSMVYLGNSMLYLGTPNSHYLYQEQLSPLRIINLFGPFSNRITSIVYDPENGYLYIGLYHDEIVVFNPSNDSVVKEISYYPDFALTNCLDYIPSLNEVVATTSTGVVGVNATDNSVIYEFNTTFNPTQIAYDLSNNNIYLATQVHDAICVINAKNGSKVGTINLDVSAIPAIAYDPNTSYIYAATSNPSYFDVINADTGRVVYNVSIGFSPNKILYNPVNKLIYLLGTSGNGSGVIKVFYPYGFYFISTIGIKGSPGASVIIPQTGCLLITSSAVITEYPTLTYFNMLSLTQVVTQTTSQTTTQTTTQSNTQTTTQSNTQTSTQTSSQTTVEQTYTSQTISSTSTLTSPKPPTVTSRSSFNPLLIAIVVIVLLIIIGIILILRRR